MRKKVCIALAFVLAVMPYHCLGQAALSGDFGASPTTMGTIGESFNLRYRPLRFLDLGLSGEHRKEFEEKLAYQREGVPLRGNIARDTYAGRASLGPRFALGPLELSPFAAIDISRTAAYSIARLAEPDFPDGCSGFVDFDETRLDWGAMGGLDLGFEAGALFLEARAAYGPAQASSLSGTMLQTYYSYLGADLYPTYLWKRVAYDHDTTGYYVEGFLSAGLALPRVGLELRGFARFAKGRFSADGANEVTVWTPHRQSVGAVTDLINPGSTSNPVKIDSDRTSLEAGASIGLLFLQKALSLRGTPSVDVSYVRLADETTTVYTDSMDVLKWVEDFDYVKFALRFGL